MRTDIKQFDVGIIAALYAADYSSEDVSEVELLPPPPQPAARMMETGPSNADRNVEGRIIRTKTCTLLFSFLSTLISRVCCLNVKPLKFSCRQAWL